MGKLVVGTGILFVMALSLCGQSAPVGRPLPADAPVALTINEPVVQLLDLIQRTAVEQEFALCLLGRVTPDSTMITSAIPARIREAGRAHVNFDCPRNRSVIGTAHNHPPGSVGCAVSIIDLLGFVHASPGVAVAVHTCTDADGSTGIVVRRRDRHYPTVITYRPDYLR